MGFIGKTIRLGITGFVYQSLLERFTGVSSEYAQHWSRLFGRRWLPTFEEFSRFSFFQSFGLIVVGIAFLYFTTRYVIEYKEIFIASIALFIAFIVAQIFNLSNSTMTTINITTFVVTWFLSLRYLPKTRSSVSKTPHNSEESPIPKTRSKNFLEPEYILVTNQGRQKFRKNS